MDEVLLTKEGLQKMEADLEHLKTVKRREVAERIKAARAQGDLLENSEYDDAKNEQAQLEARIVNLERLLRKARLVSDEEVDPDRVHIGSQVEVRDLDRDEVHTYTIVGSNEADPFEGRISYQSPVGKALFGRAVGDELDIQTPGGLLRYQILSINRPSSET
ncbi:MAG TPA: transcription elongation factor GreA [Sphingobacteriaceae bacterium]|nr:transcription elongation factor GreA [Sphingobacteriaceae bacterium]